MHLSFANPRAVTNPEWQFLGTTSHLRHDSGNERRRTTTRQRCLRRRPFYLCRSVADRSLWFATEA